MGKLLAQITRGRPQALEVRFLGQFEKDPEPVAGAVAKGLLSRVLGEEAVNLVSARPLLKDRGIALTTLRSEEAGEYTRLLEVRLSTDQEERRARGVVIGGRPRLVGIDDYALEVVPEGYMLVCVNYDRPGVVGQVGTLLGEAKVNIAGMCSGGTCPGGGPFVLTVDQKPTPRGPGGPEGPCRCWNGWTWWSSDATPCWLKLSACTLVPQHGMPRRGWGGGFGVPVASRAGRRRGRGRKAPWLGPSCRRTQAAGT